MFETIKYTSQFSENSESFRDSTGYLFNGIKIVSSGFKSTEDNNNKGLFGSAWRVDNKSNNGNFIESTQTPIVLDIIYYKSTDTIKVLESGNTVLDYTNFLINNKGSYVYKISSVVDIIDCGNYNNSLNISDFSNIISSKKIQNINNSNYPLYVKYGSLKSYLNEEYTFNEWPNKTQLLDVTNKINENCINYVNIFNNTAYNINSNLSSNGVSIRIELKPTIVDILNSLFSPSVDTLYRIKLYPIITYLSSINKNIDILYPYKLDSISNLDYIIFTPTGSQINQNIIYKISLYNKEEKLFDSISTGEYQFFNSLLTFNIKPITYFYSNNNSVSKNIEKQINFNEIKDGGIPQNCKNIIAKIEESLVLKLKEYKNLRIEIYANDGIRK